MGKSHQLSHSNAEIDRLQCDNDRLVKSRASLHRQNTKTEADVAEFKRLEEELRGNVKNLLGQIKETEEDANATVDELKSTLNSLSTLLRTREDELSREVVNSSRANAEKQKLERSNLALTTEVASLKAEWKADSESKALIHNAEVASLKAEWKADSE